MNKFKVGDKVVRIGKDYKDIKKGGIYVVSEVSKNANKWSCGINLEGHYNKNGELEYESNNFELYEESNMSDKGLLTPLQTAEAMLKDKDIEFLSDFNNEWVQVGRPYSQQCLTRLSEYKLRLKPSKILINGIPVPAPAKLEEIKDYFYILGVSGEIIHKVDKMYIGDNKNFWATEEDAQEVLDAMLLPFKEY